MRHCDVPWLAGTWLPEGKVNEGPSDAVRDEPYLHSDSYHDVSMPAPARLFRLMLMGIVTMALVSGLLPATSPTVVRAATTFTDIADSKFRSDIEWLAARGITSGCAPHRFCPTGLIARDQMATFLARAFSLGTTARDYFTDDDQSKHEDRINRAAAAGITRGCGPGRFCPSGLVTRAQMASLLARAMDLPPTPADYFADDAGNKHEDAINRVAAAGVTRGCADRRVCPSGFVSREQMAAFIRRALEGATPIAVPPPCPTTLQSLVDRAAAGATVTAPACTYRETVRIDKPLTLTTAGGRVDGERVRTHAFVVTSSDVTIDGFEITGTTNPAQDGAVRVRSADRFTLRNAHIHRTGGACVSIAGGSGHRVLDSELAYCAQQGYHITAVSNTTVARNRIHHNNPNFKYDPGWEAGGGKATVVRGLTFDANESYANNGPGLWCDVDCRDVTYRNNRIWDNTGPGIHFETSVGATIAGNRVWGNGYAWPAWGWGAGILISSSAGADIHGNVVAWNADGIVVLSQARGDNPGVRNNHVHDNVIMLSPRSSDTSDKFLLGWLEDHAGGVYSSAANNRGSGNRYWHAQAEPTWSRFGWNGAISRLTEFNATPGEASGRYLTRTERDVVLSDARMPGPP